MNKFKRGDHVKLVDNKEVAAKLGATAVVMGYSLDPSEYVKIKWNREDMRCGTQSDGGYYEYMFKLKDKDWDEEENERSK